MKLLLILTLLAGSAAAQDEPLRHLVAAGLGFQGVSADQRQTGFTVACNEMVERTLGCLTTDYTASGQATQGAVYLKIAQWRIVHLFGEGGAGAATGSSGGVGGSFSGGGAVAINLEPLLKLKGLYALVTVKWLKSNVNEPDPATSFLRDAASRTAVNIGIGRGW